MRDFNFRGCKQSFCFQDSFCPVKRGNRAGSTRNESDCILSQRDPDQFPAFRESQLREFRVFLLAHFSNVVIKLAVEHNEGSDPFFFSSKKIEK